MVLKTLFYEFAVSGITVKNLITTNLKGATSKLRAVSASAMLRLPPLPSTCKSLESPDGPMVMKDVRERRVHKAAEFSLPPILLIFQ